MENQEIFAKLENQDNHNLSIAQRLTRLEEKIDGIEKKRAWWGHLISGIIGGISVGIAMHYLH